ncbi:hypothetical protein VTK56DRAFT_2337 [Thermocarpiscus australiensis]
MAPKTGSSVDLRAQIIANCKFFSAQDADISLVTATESNRFFKAIVLRAENGRRNVLLSETASSLHGALQELHLKSAEAVRDYVANNGFAFVPSDQNRGYKRAGEHDDGEGSDSASVSSTLTLDDALSACESLSDDETVSVTSVGRAKGRSRRNASKMTSAKGKATPSRSSDSGDDRKHCDSDADMSPNPPNRRPVLRGLSQPMRFPAPRPQPQPQPQPARHGLSAFTMAPPPPPPPPPPAPFSGAGPAYGPSTTTCISRAPAAPAPPKPQSHPAVVASSASPTTPLLHDICILIRWRNHGERRTLARQARVTVQTVTHAALAYVRRQPTAFANVTAAETIGRLWQLRAAVRSVTVEGEEYDLGGYGGDDLTRLVVGGGGGGKAGVRGIPRFEVEVTGRSSDGGSAPPPAPGQQMRPVTSYPPPPHPPPAFVASGSAAATGGGGAGAGAGTTTVVIPSPPPIHMPELLYLGSWRK